VAIPKHWIGAFFLMTANFGLPALLLIGFCGVARLLHEVSRATLLLQIADLEDPGSARFELPMITRCSHFRLSSGYKVFWLLIG
jgi:hypothetical protein